MEEGKPNVGIVSVKTSEQAGEIAKKKVVIKCASNIIGEKCGSNFRGICKLHNYGTYVRQKGVGIVLRTESIKSLLEDVGYNDRDEVRFD